MSVFVHRELQDGHQGEPAITQERRHLGKIHESHCKPWSCLACSYLNHRVEAITEVCSSIDRMSERMNRFHKTLGVSCTLQRQLLILGIKNCCELELQKPDYLLLP